MAVIMQVSIDTIKFHRKNIIRKCGGGKQIDFQQYGVEHGLVTADDLIRGEGGMGNDCTN
jgi:DNA-binding NarL/FixJ family response regulator